jgi:hypothetical protein
MNTKKIIAELRRSAVCDDYPLTSCGHRAYKVTYERKSHRLAGLIGESEWTAGLERG